MKFRKFLNLDKIPNRKINFFEEPDPFAIESIFFNPFIEKSSCWTYQNKR